MYKKVAFISGKKFLCEKEENILMFREQKNKKVITIFFDLKYVEWNLYYKESRV